MQKISIHQYLMEMKDIPIVDVRSPSEYTKGHVPGSINIPLFDDTERAIIGTLYKQKGKEEAIQEGLGIAGSKMQDYVRSLKSQVSTKDLALHCWRGGKRSQSLAWLFDFVGYRVHYVEGGYKAYRQYIRSALGKYDLNLIVIGGFTGSGKTEILHYLKEQGEQVIDLEQLAQHKGSAFGALNQPNQPNNEQFENMLFKTISRLDHSKRIWIENESKGIGKVYLPNALWQKMKSAPLVHLEIPVSKRAAYLAQSYGSYKDELLLSSFNTIRKKIGGQNHQLAEIAIRERDYVTAASIGLKYYDKTYHYNLQKNPSPKIITIESEVVDPMSNAQKIIEQFD